MEELSAQPERLRSALYQSLPEEMTGVYSRANRNHFFRKSFFLQVCQEAFAALDLAAGSAEPVLCFLAERQDSLYGFNKITVL